MASSGERGTHAYWVLIAAIVAGLSYLGAAHAGVGPVASVAWKGAGVALLAVYAARHARSGDGWLITAVMAFGALGDVLLETHGLIAGASAFVAGHITAMALYFRNWRPRISFSQRLLAALVVPLSVLIAAMLTPDHSKLVSVAVYTFFAAGMAASAWTSRFPRYRTGIGAMMFLASDLLIFARAGPLAGTIWIDAAIWELYFVGQALICVGVVGALRR
jgi:uncharacterized membrane protein YhhN